MMVLGKLRPESFLAGSMTVDPALAEQALASTSASRSASTSIEAAASTVGVITHSMIQAIELNSVQKGYDPRDFTLVALGGAGGLFVCDIAIEMGIPRVLVPPQPGNHLRARPAGYRHRVRVLHHRDDAAGGARLGARAGALRAPRRARPRAAPQRRRDRRRSIELRHYADCRYANQGYELMVAAPDLGVGAEEWAAGVAEGFHVEHERQYSRRFDGAVHLVNLRTMAVGRRPPLRWPELEPGDGDVSGAQVHEQEVVFVVGGQREAHATRFYDRAPPARRRRGGRRGGDRAVRLDHRRQPRNERAGRSARKPDRGGAMSDTQTALDPMTLRVLGGAFGAIAKEMAQVIFRTAFFQIIREAEDLGAGLYTADGEEIAESETTAMHCGSIGAYIRGLNEIWGDDIAEGDVFLHNDPLHGASHIADVCIAVPVFWEGKLVAWAADTAHLADLGAASAGLCTDAFDYFADGRNYAALKIEKQGVRNDELIRHIFENVRTPDINRGDIEALYTASQLGARRFRGLLEKYGLDVVMSAAHAWMDHCEQLLRREIEKVPDGDYVAPVQWMDDDARQPRRAAEHQRDREGARQRHHDRPHRQPRRGGDGGERDRSRAPPRSPPTSSFARSSSTSSRTTPTSRTTRGCSGRSTSRRPRADCSTRASRAPPTRASAPARSRPTACCSRWPRPCPSRSAAGTGAEVHVIAFSGLTEETRDYWVYVQVNESSWGGRFGKDGMDSIGCLMENIRNNPIEEEELSFPIRVERYELRDEGPAPGRWRGGLGVIRATRSLGEGWVTSEAERQYDPPKGLFGGYNGRTAMTEVRRADGTVLNLPSKFTTFKLLAGDTIEFRTACGGGYGDPLEREPEQVARDVRDQLMSAESARTDYGVVLDPVTLEPDLEATERERASRG